MLWLRSRPIIGVSSKKTADPDLRKAKRKHEQIKRRLAILGIDMELARRNHNASDSS